MKMNSTEQNVITEYGPSGFHNDRGEQILLPAGTRVLQHRMGQTGPILTVRHPLIQGDIVLPVKEVPA